MRILVVGSGAREDALSWRLSRSPSCTDLLHAPGNAGTAARGENVDVAATDARGLARVDQTNIANNGANISDLGAYELQGVVERA